MLAETRDGPGVGPPAAYMMQGILIMTKNFLAGAALMTAATMLAAPAARAGSDEANLVSRARIVVDDLKTDQEFGNARSLLRRARGVLIVPQLIKGGFFVGGEGGSGVLLARTATGWSDPAFYTMGSASFGLQIGLQSAEVVMLIMSEKGLNALMSDQFKIGADAGVTVVTIGSNAEIATTSAARADVIVWASSSGAYAGITVNGSIVKPRESWNESYYGHPATTRQIISNPVGLNREAIELRRDLRSVS